MFGVNHPFPDACKIIQIWLYVTVQPTLYHQKSNITLKKNLNDCGIQPPRINSINQQIKLGFMIPLFFCGLNPQKKSLHLHWSPEPLQNIPPGGECLRIFRLRTANLSHPDDVGPWEISENSKTRWEKWVSYPKRL